MNHLNFAHGISVGQIVGSHKTGLGKLIKFTEEEATIEVTYRKTTEWGVPYGPKLKKQLTCPTHELMEQADYEYACWKGTAGAGKRLKDCIKIHNK